MKYKLILNCLDLVQFFIEIINLVLMFNKIFKKVLKLINVEFIIFFQKIIMYKIC